MRGLTEPLHRKHNTTFLSVTGTCASSCRTHVANNANQTNHHTRTMHAYPSSHCVCLRRSRQQVLDGVSLHGAQRLGVHGGRGDGDVQRQPGGVPGGGAWARPIPLARAARRAAGVHVRRHPRQRADDPPQGAREQQSKALTSAHASSQRASPQLPSHRKHRIVASQKALASG